MLKIVLLVVLPAICLGQGMPSWSVIAHDLFDAVDANGDSQWTRYEMDDYFDMFDENGDGRISRHEFTVQIDALADYFIGHEHEWYDNFDINNDHHLDHIDFNFAFYYYDTDKDGIVHLSEYEQVLGLTAPTTMAMP